jgi:hypothetical protein
MSDIIINADVFFERLSALYALWKQDKRSSDGVFGGADSIVIITGKASESENIYQKNNSFHVSLDYPRDSVSASSFKIDSGLTRT